MDPQFETGFSRLHFQVSTFIPGPWMRQFPLFIVVLSRCHCNSLLVIVILSLLCLSSSFLLWFCFIFFCDSFILNFSSPLVMGAYASFESKVRVSEIRFLFMLSIMIMIFMLIYFYDCRIERVISMYWFINSIVVNDSV